MNCMDHQDLDVYGSDSSMPFCYDDLEIGEIKGKGKKERKNLLRPPGEENQHAKSVRPEMLEALEGFKKRLPGRLWLH